MYGNVTTAIACGLLLIANVLIAWSLYSNTRQMKSLQEVQGTNSKTEAAHQQKNRQISLMLLLVSCFFIFSNFPDEFNNQFWPRHLDLARTLPDLRRLSLEISVFIEVSNSAVNFYLYVASCRKFRTTLRRKFKPEGKHKPRTVIPSNNERCSTRHQET